MRCAASLLVVVLVALIVNAQQPQKNQTSPEDQTSPEETNAADPTEKPTSFWMDKKMEYSQEILRGLAMRDFKKIGTNAEQMRLLGKVEGFVRGGKPTYRPQLRTFDRVCDDLIVQAKEENLPGVTLAFNQLTVSCVSCHESLRTRANAPAAAEDAAPNAKPPTVSESR